MDLKERSAANERSAQLQIQWKKDVLKLKVYISSSLRCFSIIPNVAETPDSTDSINRRKLILKDIFSNHRLQNSKNLEMGGVSAIVIGTRTEIKALL